MTREKLYSVNLYAEGGRYRYDVTAPSQKEALFLAGMVFGSEHPDFDRENLEFKVTVE
jgi:hypothetical protein